MCIQFRNTDMTGPLVHVNRDQFYHGLHGYVVPPQYRPVCSALEDNILALGCSSGQVLLIEFS